MATENGIPCDDYTPWDRLATLCCQYGSNGACFKTGRSDCNGTGLVSMSPKFEGTREFMKANDNVMGFERVPEVPQVKPSNPKDALGIRKPPQSTVPQNVMAEVGVGMLEGALKYGRHNYRVLGVRASVYYDATRRHLDCWWEGEDIDPDSNLSHITKAITSLIVLRDAMMNDKMNDDRPPKSDVVGERARLGVLVDTLLDKYPEPKDAFMAMMPKHLE